MAVTEYAGRRFDWRPRFDERSRAFPVRAPEQAVALRSTTWRDPYLLDQGQIGSCVGNGHAGRIGANPLGRFVDEDFAVKLYHLAQSLDQWPDAEQDDDSGTSVLAGAKAAHKLGYYSSYRWAFSLDDVLHALSNEGPVVIGMNWYEGMMEPDASGIIRPTGDIVGGHCVVVRGIAIRRQWVRIRNSWGDWGPLGGDARIRWADLERLINEDGEQCCPTEIALV